MGVSVVLFRGMNFGRLGRDAPMMTTRIKVIVIGDSTCGKTSLLRQFVDKRFDPLQDMTVGVDLGFKNIQIGERFFKAQIWDTSGQEVFQSITRVYYRGAHVILLVYDVTNERSYVHVKKWFDHIRSVWRDDYSPTVILVGNKTDLGCHRVISTEEGEAFAWRHDMMFCETSAKTGEGVEDAFLLPVFAFVKTHPSILYEEAALELETPGEGLGMTLTSDSGCCWW